MRYVVLPQALRRMVPALVNEAVSLVKDFVAGVGDRPRRAGAGRAHRRRRLLALLGALSPISAVYLAITLTLSALARRLEAPAHLRGR